MTGFEFAFTLFGLLLGLALTEGLSGLARAFKSRHLTAMGWPTALLGAFVACDVVTFWMYGWSMRDRITLGWPLMFGGFILTGTYYVCASLIFPDDKTEDFNAHFDRNRRLVIGGVLACNIALVAFTLSLVAIPNASSLRTIILTWTFFPVAVLAVATRSRRLVVGCLIWLIGLYPLSAVWLQT